MVKNINMEMRLETLIYENYNSYFSQSGDQVPSVNSCQSWSPPQGQGPDFRSPVPYPRINPALG